MTKPDISAAVLNLFSAEELMDAALAKKDPSAAAALYKATYCHERAFVAEWKATCTAVQAATDDLFDLMEWLRATESYEQADRLRTLIGRLARAIPAYPCFGVWGNPDLIRNIARTFPEQLSIKESKSLLAEMAKLKGGHK